jgi:hypothetical protein
LESTMSLRPVVDEEFPDWVHLVSKQNITYS